MYIDAFRRAGQVLLAAAWLPHGWAAGWTKAAMLRQFD
jgi:hypothetical protein